MPKSVIDIDRLNNLNAKMGKLSMPTKKVSGAVKTAKKMTKPITRKVKTTTKKMKKMGKR